MPGRTNAMTTLAPRTAAPTAKRSAGQLRLNSDANGTNNSVSIIVGGNPQESTHPEPLNVITEVDGIIIIRRRRIFHIR